MLVNSSFVPPKMALVRVESIREKHGAFLNSFHAKTNDWCENFNGSKINEINMKYRSYLIKLCLLVYCVCVSLCVCVYVYVCVYVCVFTEYF